MASQDYEFAFWNDERRNIEQSIRAIRDDFINNKTRSIGKSAIRDRVMKHIVNKSVLEVGCGPLLGYLPYMSMAKETIAIEPLLEKYALLWDGVCNGVTDISINSIINKKFSFGAEKYIPELEGVIDGLIISVYSLDHTPNWPFVLCNIASYAAKGSYFGRTYIMQ